MRSNLRRVRQSNTLVSQNYNTRTTIGPRQASILFDILVMNKAGIPVTRDTLTMRHPAHALNGNAFESLRARGLVKGNGRGWKLTLAGESVANLIDKSAAAGGLGFVAVEVPTLP